MKTGIFVGESVMKKFLKFTGIALAVIIVILLLLIGAGQVMKNWWKIGRLPEGTGLVLIDTNDKPSQSNFSNETPPDFGWPVSQTYQKYAENFQWWLINFPQLGRTGKAMKEDKPTLAVVFNLPAEEIPALASFAGKVQMVSMTQSGNGSELTGVELSNGKYVARYEYILGPTVKECTTVQRGDTIGTVAFAPRAVFPKENLGPWKKWDTMGNFNFQFSLFKIGEGGSEEPIWITTESFAQ